MTVTATDATFDEIIAGPEPVLVDFWAEWCGPCKQIAPILEDIAGEMAGKLTVAKLNVDDNPEVAGRYAIRSIPTLLLFRDGKLSDTKVGVLPKNQLVSWLTPST